MNSQGKIGDKNGRSAQHELSTLVILFETRCQHPLIAISINFFTILVYGP